ncbi:MAG: hypothetical protein ACPLRY_04535 [Candidatus Bathyarchaeales archaeon]
MMIVLGISIYVWIIIDFRWGIIKIVMGGLLINEVPPIVITWKDSLSLPMSKI